MRMDLVKPRYETFDELYEYCYKVAGTVGLMTTPVMGIEPSYTVRYKASLVRSCDYHQHFNPRESTCRLFLSCLDNCC